MLDVKRSNRSVKPRYCICNINPHLVGGSVGFPRSALRQTATRINEESNNSSVLLGYAREHCFLVKDSQILRLFKSRNNKKKNDDFYPEDQYSQVKYINLICIFFCLGKTSVERLSYCTSEINKKSHRDPGNEERLCKSR